MIKTEDKVVNIYIYGAEVNHLWCRSEPLVRYWYGTDLVRY